MVINGDFMMINFNGDLMMINDGNKLVVFISTAAMIEFNHQNISKHTSRHLRNTKHIQTLQSQLKAI